MAKELAADVYDYNFLNDRICSRLSGMWYYRDIVGVRLSERAASCRLPNGTTLSRVTKFSLSVPSGEGISAVVGGDEILELTGAQKLFGDGVEIASTLATAINARVRGVNASLI